jgi:hypothetical protein
MVEHVANDFENEYMQPDDPSRHGRVFAVTEAGAYLVLRLNRDESGRESITIVDGSMTHSDEKPASSPATAMPATCSNSWSSGTPP